MFLVLCGATAVAPEVLLFWLGCWCLALRLQTLALCAASRRLNGREQTNQKDLSSIAAQHAMRHFLPAVSLVTVTSCLLLAPHLSIRLLMHALLGGAITHFTRWQRSGTCQILTAAPPHRLTDRPPGGEGQGAREIIKAGVAPFPRGRGHCIPLWAVFPPLRVVLSSACSVASLSRYPSHYLPGHPHLRGDALADYPFGRGNPSTWRAGRTPFHDVTSAKPPSGAQRSMTLPRCNLDFKHFHLIQTKYPPTATRQNAAVRENYRSGSADPGAASILDLGFL